jgi:hypothetical protein
MGKTSGFREIDFDNFPEKRWRLCRCAEFRGKYMVVGGVCSICHNKGLESFEVNTKEELPKLELIHG